METDRSGLSPRGELYLFAAMLVAALTWLSEFFSVLVWLAIGVMTPVVPVRRHLRRDDSAAD